MDDILQVRREDHAGVPVVRAAGEVDVSSSPALRSELMAIPADTPKVIVDLSEVTFLDSTGLGVLVAAKKHIAEGGADGVVHLVVVRPQVRKVIEVTGLDAVFSLYLTLDEALSS